MRGGIKVRYSYLVEFFKILTDTVTHLVPSKGCQSGVRLHLSWDLIFIRVFVSGMGIGPG